MKDCIDKESYLQKYGVNNIRNVIFSISLAGITVNIVKLVLMRTYDNDMKLRLMNSTICFIVGMCLRGSFWKLRIFSNFALGLVLVVMTEGNAAAAYAPSELDACGSVIPKLFKVKEYILFWLILNVQMFITINHRAIVSVTLFVVSFGYYNIRMLYAYGLEQTSDLHSYSVLLTIIIFRLCSQHDNQL